MILPSADLTHLWAVTTNKLVGSESQTVAALPKRWTFRGAGHSDLPGVTV